MGNSKVTVTFVTLECITLLFQVIGAKKSGHNKIYFSTYIFFGKLSLERHVLAPLNIGVWLQSPQSCIFTRLASKHSRHLEGIYGAVDVTRMS